MDGENSNLQMRIETLNKLQNDVCDSSNIKRAVLLYPYINPAIDFRNSITKDDQFNGYNICQSLDKQIDILQNSISYLTSLKDKLSQSPDVYAFDFISSKVIISGSDQVINDLNDLVSQISESDLDDEIFDYYYDVDSDDYLEI